MNSRTNFISIRQAVAEKNTKVMCGQTNKQTDGPKRNTLSESFGDGNYSFGHNTSKLINVIFTITSFNQWSVMWFYTKGTMDKFPEQPFVPHFAISRSLWHKYNFFYYGPRTSKSYVYWTNSFKWSTSPPLEHLNCIRCGDKWELLLPACRLDDRRRHLHFCW